MRDVFRIAWTYLPTWTSLLVSRQDVAPAPPRVASISNWSLVLSDNPPAPNKNYFRDGGYRGSIGNRTFTLSYDAGVALYPNESNWDVLYENDWHIAGVNSFAWNTDDPAIVHDPGVFTMCASKEEFHIWITNTISLSDTQGLAYFQTIRSDTGRGAEQPIASAPALIDVSNTSKPTCERFSDEFWTFPESPAMFGNQGVIEAPDGLLYLYGSGGPNLQFGNKDGNWSVHLARVSKGSFNMKRAYQYWNGKRFVPEESQSRPVWTGFGGGSVTWSEYHNAYLYLSTGLYYTGIYAQLAYKPWGPWSDKVFLFQYNENHTLHGAYQPNGFPEYDPSGRTLQVRASVVRGLYQRVNTVTWE